MPEYRLYGQPPYKIVLVHGGPGAAGGLAPLAIQLSENYSVIEHLQTKESLSGQLRGLKKDLDDSASVPVILIGHSWGAWLGYLFAAEYPLLVKKLILVASGPFEDIYTRGLLGLRRSRLTNKQNKRLSFLLNELEDQENVNKNRIFCEIGFLMDKADSFQPLSYTNEWLECNYSIYEKIWEDASKLRENKSLLLSGKQIACPVVAIHGDYDPHPYEGVSKPLAQVLSNFRCVVLKNCGHKPWIEKFAKDMFYDTLKKELE